MSGQIRFPSLRSLNDRMFPFEQVRISEDGEEEVHHGRTEQSSVRAGRQTEAKTVHVAFGEADAPSAQLMAILDRIIGRPMRFQTERMGQKCAQRIGSSEAPTNRILPRARSNGLLLNRYTFEGRTARPTARREFRATDTCDTFLPNSKNVERRETWTLQLLEILASLFLSRQPAKVL